MSGAGGGARLAVTEAGAAGAPNSADGPYAANSADAPSAANSTVGPFAANSTDGPSAANSTDAPFAPAHNGTDYASESRPTIQVYLIESDSWPSAAGGSIDTWKFLEYLVWPLQTNQTNYSFSTRTYSDLGTLLDAAEADSAVLSAGSVVIYPVHAHISTRNYTGGAKGSVLNHSVDDSRSIDPYCAYQFADVDPLLLAPPVQRLLAWPKPLVLVDASDWACRTTYPPTIHQVWRNAYGGGALMEHARFVPFGVSLLRDASNWKHNATRARATPISARPWALAAINSLSQRKTERVHVHRLMSGGMEAELRNISLRRGTAGIVVDYERQGENETSYDFESTDGGEDYEQVLARARFFLAVAGDVWTDSNIWNAVEFGAIPVVQRRASYKGCVDPTGWLERSEAPVLWLDEWSDLPAALDAALADEAALEARRLALVRWWEAAKLEIGAAMVAFHARWRDADAYPANDCASVALTRAQDAAYQAETDAFYGDEHWFDNFDDSPWLQSMLCYKHKTQNWAGLQCYSPRCAEPATAASFTCGNRTISAKAF